MVSRNRGSVKRKQQNQPPMISYRPLALAIAFAFSSTLPSIAQAGTFTVTTIANSGAGSLRQAVLDANATLDTPDTILFNSSVSGQTITLSSELAVTDTLTITGPTAGVASSIVLDGGSNIRIINAGSFPVSSGKSVTLENITLQNGKTTAANDKGGALYIRNADLTLNHSSISNNATAGLNASGGGIFSNAMVTLNQSTISGNSTIGDEARAGGIYAADLTAIQSTISGNSTTGLNGSGGGLLVDKNAIIRQSTVSGNSVTGTDAGGGGIFVGLTTKLYNSTVYANTSVNGGAGLSVYMDSGRSVDIVNSILSGNTHTGSGIDQQGNLHDRANSIAAYINSSYSIFGDNSAELTGINISNIFSNNPNLGPLLDNGGPVLTHFPNDISNASDVVNKGKNTYVSLANDQRGAGFDRIVDTTVDIGAVEVQTTKPSVVNNNNDNGAGSLRQAVLYTNNSPSLDTIDLSGLAPSQTINLNSELVISDSLIISGPTSGDSSSLILDGGDTNRHIKMDFSSSSGQTLTLENITLQNGTSANSGGAVYVNNADLNLQNALISNNSTTGFGADGGGLHVTGGNVTLSQSTVSDNSTMGDLSQGGGLSVVFGNATLTQSTVSDNSTAGFNAHGGGLYVAVGNATLTQSTVSGNSTTGNNAQGGGLYVAVGNATLSQSTFSGNSTSGVLSQGGGGFVIDGNATLTQSTVSSNSTTGNYASGGGLAVYRGDATLIQSTVSSNSTSGSIADGGGLIIFTGDVLLNQSTVTNNSSSLGAGLYVYAYAGNSQNVTIDITLNNSVLSGNNISDTQNNDNLSLGYYLAPNGTVIFNVNASHSIFGDSASEINNTNTNNIFDNNPRLGPLQNNGGPTLTRLPNSGSPALDAGSNTIATNAGFTEDQRGSGFDRIINGDVDIGATESPILPSQFSVLIRAEIVKPLLQAALFQPTMANNPYGDVANNSLNADWIETFKAEGFAQVCAPNRFCPNEVVTKGKLALMIKNVKDLPLLSYQGLYSDVPNTHPNALEIEALSDAGFATDCATGRYCPNEVLTLDKFNDILNKAYR